MCKNGKQRFTNWISKFPSWLKLLIETLSITTVGFALGIVYELGKNFYIASNSEPGTYNFFTILPYFWSHKMGIASIIISIVLIAMFIVFNNSDRNNNEKEIIRLLKSIDSNTNNTNSIGKSNENK